MLLYSRMRELGIQPDNFTFPFVLKACGYVKDAKFEVVVHGNVMEFGYESDVVVGNSLIAM